MAMENTLIKGVYLHRPGMIVGDTAIEMDSLIQMETWETESRGETEHTIKRGKVDVVNIINILVSVAIRTD